MYLKKPVHNSIVILVVFMVSIGLWLNITNQVTMYGTQNGKFSDQVDSYSEYIIRNTVLNKFIGTENVGGTLIITKGYPKEDYSYYPDETVKYYSHRGIQVYLFEEIGRFNKELFIENSDRFFQAFRFLNCLLLTVCVSAFFIGLFGKNLIALISLVIFSFAGGVALFASNLYFMSWILFTPLLCFPVLVRGYSKTYVFFALVFSMLYFSVRYEFATTFALLWLFPVLALRLKTGSIDVKTAIYAFAATCLGFSLALLAHHLSVASELQISIDDASELIFTNTQVRVLSLKGVPVPFSNEFFQSMIYRWKWTGLSAPLLFSIPKLWLLILFIVIFIVISIKTKGGEFKMLFIWALLAYGSWYLFAYQHILWHVQYDSLLFAATIQMVLLICLITWVCRIFDKRRLV